MLIGTTRGGGGGGGGDIVTEIFKSRGHQSLVDLERSGQGFRIGQTDTSAPTCADYITLTPTAVRTAEKLGV